MRAWNEKDVQRRAKDGWGWREAERRKWGRVGQLRWLTLPSTSSLCLPELAWMSFSGETLVLDDS